MSYNKLITIIEEISAFFEELIEFENQKLDAVAKNDTDALDGYMKEEQVYLLKLKGLDKKRESELESLGLKGKSFKEIVEQSDEQSRQELQNSYEILNELVDEYKQTSSATKKYIELHLHSLGRLIEQLEGERGGTYDKQGGKLVDPTAFTSKRV